MNTHSYKWEYLKKMETLRAHILEFVRSNPNCFFVQIKYSVPEGFTKTQISGAVSSMVRRGELVSTGPHRNEKRFNAIATATDSADNKLLARKDRNSSPRNKESFPEKPADAVSNNDNMKPRYSGPKVDPNRPWVTVHREGDTAPAKDSRGQGGMRDRVHVNCFINF